MVQKYKTFIKQQKINVIFLYTPIPPSSAIF